MSWTENKILMKHSPYTPCKEIFKAVCDELGEYFSNKGFKYARSRPKLTYKDEEIKLEIGFSSSGSNTPGDYVNLEIIPSFYSLEIETKNDGYLFGHTALFYHKYLDDPKYIKVLKIYGDVLLREDPYSTESVIIESNNCNVYGITEEKFLKIIAFIETKILVWLEKLKTEEGILELMENPSSYRKYGLFGNSNSGFRKYVEMKFPRVELPE